MPAAALVARLQVVIPLAALVGGAVRVRERAPGPVQHRLRLGQRGGVPRGGRGGQGLDGHDAFVVVAHVQREQSQRDHVAGAVGASCGRGAGPNTWSSVALNTLKSSGLVQ